MSVTIGTGKAWINGHYFINDSPYVLDLSRYAEQALSKYVIIGICCNTGDNFREISITVEPGAGADAPEIPSFFETPTETYLTLAAVYLPAGVAALSSDNIVDYRDDASKCGYVKCILGKCGVTELQAAFSELESSLSMLEMQLNSLSETVDTFINSGGGGGGGDCNCGPKLDALEDRIAALEDFAAKGGFVGPGPAPGPGPGTGGDGPNVWFGTAIYGTIAIQRLYEDNIEGKVSNERFSRMSASYEEEQHTLESRVAELKALIASEKERSASVDSFLTLVRKYTDIQELTAEVIREFVEKVYVYQTERVGGYKVQRIRIVWNCIGEFTLPSDEDKGKPA